MIRISAVTITVAFALALAACGSAGSSKNGGSDGGGDGGGDSEGPTVLSVAPASGSTLGAGYDPGFGTVSDLGDTITIVFSGTMNPPSLTFVSADITVETWDDTDWANDTLVLTPFFPSCGGTNCFSPNSSGAIQIVLEVDDLEGNTIDTLTLDYDIDNNGNGYLDIDQDADWIEDELEAEGCVNDSSC